MVFTHVIELYFMSYLTLRKGGYSDGPNLIIETYESGSETEEVRALRHETN